MNFSEIAEMADNFNKLFVAGQDADSIYNIITGNDGDPTMEALIQIDSDIVNGFQKVVNAIADNQLVTTWNANDSSVITGLNNAVMTFSNSVSSANLIKTTDTTQYPSGYYVKGSPSVDFAQWATGPFGPLATLSSYLEPNAIESLYDLFISSPAGNGNLITNYLNLVQAAQASPQNPVL